MVMAGSSKKTTCYSNFVSLAQHYAIQLNKRYRKGTYHSEVSNAKAVPVYNSSVFVNELELLELDFPPSVT